MSKSTEWKIAVIAHCVLNHERTTNPFSQARSRIHEVNEWFKAIEDEEKKPPVRSIDNRPPSDNTIAVQIELDRLNGKSE